MLYTHISEQKRFFCLSFYNFFFILTCFFSPAHAVISTTALKTLLTGKKKQARSVLGTRLPEKELSSGISPLP